MDVEGVVEWARTGIEQSHRFAVIRKKRKFVVDFHDKFRLKIQVLIKVERWTEDQKKNAETGPLGF